MSLLYAVLGYVALAVANLIDKYTVGQRLKPIVLVVVSTAVIVPIFVAAPLAQAWLSGWSSYALAAISGVSFTVALGCMYRGFASTEVSHSAPLSGAITAAGVVVLSVLIQHETLQSSTWIGVGLLLVASVIVVFERTWQKTILSSSMLWIVLAGSGYALSNVTAKILYDTYGFWAGLIWSRGFMALAGTVPLFFSVVRRDLKNLIFSGAPQSRSLPASFIVVINRIIGVAGVLLIQVATARGSVVVVNALQGLQYIVLIILVLLSSRFTPRFEREYFTPREVVQELVAVVLMIAGLILVLS